MKRFKKKPIEEQVFQDRVDGVVGVFELNKLNYWTEVSSKEKVHIKCKEFRNIVVTIKRENGKVRYWLEDKYANTIRKLVNYIHFLEKNNEPVDIRFLLDMHSDVEFKKTSNEGAVIYIGESHEFPVYIVNDKMELIPSYGDSPMLRLLVDIKHFQDTYAKKPKVVKE